MLTRIASWLDSLTEWLEKTRRRLEYQRAHEGQLELNFEEESNEPKTIHAVRPSA